MFYSVIDSHSKAELCKRLEGSLSRRLKLLKRLQNLKYSVYNAEIVVWGMSSNSSSWKVISKVGIQGLAALKTSHCMLYGLASTQASE